MTIRDKIAAEWPEVYADLDSGTDPAEVAERVVETMDEHEEAELLPLLNVLIERPDATITDEQALENLAGFLWEDPDEFPGGADTCEALDEALRLTGRAPAKVEAGAMSTSDGLGA